MKRAIAAATAVLVLSLTGYAAIKLFAVTPSPVSILAPLDADAPPAAPAAGSPAPHTSVAQKSAPHPSGSHSSAPAAPAAEPSAISPSASKASTSASAAKVTPKPPTRKTVTSTACTDNPRAQFVLVDISQQHAWMCAGGTQVYDSPVTTGAAAEGNGTPTGTWQIQGKQRNRYLTVRDGSSYHVEYWMPYDGDYGFHDAAWQTFAEGSPVWPTQGSHGCVHLPLNAMTWLYDWASAGATVTVRT